MSRENMDGNEISQAKDIGSQDDEEQLIQLESRTPSAEKHDVTSDSSNLQPVAFADPAPKTPRATSPVKETGETEADDENEDTPEIRQIMEQFETEDDGPDARDSQISPANLSEPPTFPPRRSSLGPENDLPVSPKREASAPGQQLPQQNQSGTASLPTRISSLPQGAEPEKQNLAHHLSSSSSMNLPKELPPTPDPEPDLPFDFHRFLEQLRHRTADPVARYVRSFLTEFGKKSWAAPEQVKFINDFLVFIANKMSQCEVWRNVSDAEFDNAKEGMEKLVMNRLYSQTFSPAIPPPSNVSRPKGKRKNIENVLGHGRRGQHQEDVERDDILSQKVRIYDWVQEQHLDIKPVGNNGKRLMDLAQQELSKIKGYRAPRDKVICILNSCKVIFGLLRNSKASDTSADAFVPLLILVVLRANPEHLVSNVQYILRFRNQEKLGGEAGYYLSSLMGAIQFIENLDRTSLTISDEDFEKQVETSVSAIAERNSQAPLTPAKPPQAPTYIQEKSTLSQPEVVARSSNANTSQTLPQPGKLQSASGASGSSDETAVNGLLRTIQRPLSNLGKIFTDDSVHGDGSQEQRSQAPPPVQKLSPSLIQPPRRSDDIQSGQRGPVEPPQLPRQSNRKFDAEDAAARQASAEAAEAQRIQTVEHQNIVETLVGMFPNLDKDVIDDVVRVKKGRVGLAVDACLALNT